MSAHLDAIAGSRLPVVMVEVRTMAEDAPEVHHSIYSGVRVVYGPQSVKWSDGKTTRLH